MPQHRTQHANKKSVSRKSRAARVRSIASAVVIKADDVFFLCEPDGRVPVGGGSGTGLYYHDCRFLNGYELQLAGKRPNPLLATGRDGYRMNLVLGNPDIPMADGGTIEKEDVGVLCQRVLDGRNPALYDRLTFHNYSLRPVEFPITLSFSAAFEDLFNVRGMPMKARGKLRPPRWEDGTLVFGYDGSDGLYRALAVHFSPDVERAEGTTASFQLRLQPQEQKQVLVSMVLVEAPEDRGTHAPSVSVPDFARTRDGSRDAYDDWLKKQTTTRTSSSLLGSALDRSLRDLRTLRSTLDGHAFFAAGVPWYVTLFGRDSLISALQTLAYEPEMAAHTLRLLAKYQGTKVDEWRDEQPGKIMHELRVGELAHDNKIPQTPYYGTIDATPLFLVLLHQHALWTGSLDLFTELRDNAERALTWMATYGDPMKDGYLAYQRKSKGGLGNQGWKDSGDSIMNGDGSLARAPIALCEVQGYAYLAKVGLADLYGRANEPDRAGQLRREAADLRERFNRDFWLEDKGVFALALQAGGEPCAVVASNAGQALWSGIADPDKAAATVQRLMRPDVFSGWGVRTLSAKEVRYNPVGYHLGTVWPHDNSIIAAGFRNYGFDREATKVFDGILAAASHFHSEQLPEVFAGFDKDEYGVPVHYPVACHPQAWAAGSVPFMVQTLLGLTPDAFARKLRVVRPVLPSQVRDVELRGLRVGGARVDLRFERASDGSAAVQVLKTEGELAVVVEKAPRGTS